MTFDCHQLKSRLIIAYHLYTVIAVETVATLRVWC